MLAGRLLITGATGYIGGQLARYYHQQGQILHLMVRHPANLPPDLQGAGEIVVADLTQPQTLADAIQGVDYIIHAAGLLGRWGTPYKTLQKVNVQGSLNLVRAAEQAQVKRLIHLSAGGVTGPLKSEFVDESYPPKPSTDYERTKWEGEEAVLKIARQENVNLLALRPTFTYGPGDPHKLSLFRALQKQRFAFLGDGLSTIHPVYIDDLIAGIDLALKSEVKGSAIIIGGAKPVTKRELVFSIADVLGVRRPIIHLPVWLGESLARGCELAASLLGFEPPLTRSRVLMLSRNWGYSIAKAQQVLGYQPHVDLSEGLRRTVIWYREHGWL